MLKKYLQLFRLVYNPNKKNKGIAKPSNECVQVLKSKSYVSSS